MFDDQTSPTDVSHVRFVNIPAMLNRLQGDDPDELPIYLDAGRFQIQGNSTQSF